MNEISKRLTIEEHNGKSIVFVNYRGLKEKEMIELVNAHLELTLKTKHRWLADFNEAYATPGYLAAARHFLDTTRNLIDKGALLGIDPIKVWILKGIVIAYGVNYKAFDTQEAAIKFLTEEN